MLLNLRLIRHYQQRHSRLHHQFPAIILMDTRWQPRWQPTGISQFNKLWKQVRLPVVPDSGFLDGGTTLLQWKHRPFNLVQFMFLKCNKEMASHLILLWYFTRAKVREFLLFQSWNLEKVMEKRDMFWAGTLVNWVQAKPLECVQPYFNPLHKRFVYNGNDFVGPIPKCKSEILKLDRKEIRGHGNVVRYSTE